MKRDESTMTKYKVGRLSLVVATLVLLALYMTGLAYQTFFMQRIEEITRWTPSSRQQQHEHFAMPTKGIRNSHSRKEPSILLVTFIFGEAAASKKYLRMFAETASHSGVDVLMLGHPKPDFQLPPHVSHADVTWDQFVDRVSERLFDGKEPAELRSASHYKVIDFKPLIGYLFPEKVQGYDWWGPVDNDMVLGNVRTFMTPEVLQQSDIISPIKGRSVYGPFMLYRNTKRVNELFLSSDATPEHTFATKEVKYFDEWGGGRGSTSDINTRPEHNSTMDGIVLYRAKSLGLRPYRFTTGIIGWDGACKDPDEARCQECHYSEGKLLTNHGKERIFCHYEKGKHFLEQSLEGPSNVNGLLEAGEFRVSHPEGFSTYSLDDDSISEDASIQTPLSTSSPQESQQRNSDILDIEFEQLEKHAIFEVLPPTPAGQSPCVQLDQDQMVVVGGFVGEYSNVTNLMQFFDIDNQKWKKGVALPSGIAETHQAVAFDSTSRWLYIVSGQLGGGCLPPVHTAMRIHVDSREIQMLPPVPKARYSPCAVIVPTSEGSYLHLFGGVSEDRRSAALEHWRLDVSPLNFQDAHASVWEEQELVPDAGLHGLATYHDDGYIYYTGFCTNDYAAFSESSDMASCMEHDAMVSDAHHVPRNGFYRFATKNVVNGLGHWERLEDMPFPTCQAGHMEAHNRFFLFGGLQIQSPRQGPKGHQFSQAFNFQTLSWEVLSVLPTGLSSPCVYEDKDKTVTMFRAGDWRKPGAQYPKSPVLEGTFYFDEEPPSAADRLLSMKRSTKVLHTQNFVKCLNDSLRARCHTFLSGQYENVRTSWNKRFDAQQKPNVVCFPEDTNDVAALVKCGRRSGLAICGRNGKHSFSGDTCTDGLLIDVEELKSIERLENPDTGRFLWELGSGNRLGQAASGIYEQGSVLPVGHCPSVGLTGYTQVGGQGYLSRLYGMSSDLVSAVEYVNAEGQTILATEDNEHSKALWLARGGGGYLAFPGIITSWQYNHLPRVQTQNLTADVWTEIEVYWQATLENAEAMFAGWQDLALNKDFINDPLANRLTVEAWVAFYPNRMTGRLEKILKLVAVFYGTDDLHQQASERLYPLLQKIGGPNHPPKKTKLKRFTYHGFLMKAGGVGTKEELVSGHHGWDLIDMPPTNVNRWKGHSAVATDKIPGEAIKDIVHAMWFAKPLRKRYTEFKPLRGAIQSNMNKTATGFWHRDALHWSLSSHFWHASDKPATVAALLKNARKAHEGYVASMGDKFGGSYVGYIERSNSIVPDLQRYYGGNADRILQTRHELDPHNVFRHYLPNRPEEVVSGMVKEDLLAAVPLRHDDEELGASESESEE